MTTLHTELEDCMKVPCKTCPFRRDVTPFLRPGRVEQIAELPYNPYNDFTCHNTLDFEEDSEGWAESVVTEKSLTCAGFLTLLYIEQGEDSVVIPEGFKPSDLTYESAEDMIDAYYEHAGVPRY